MTSYLDIDGKVVLITGASEGVGAACAASFRRRGARLALTARSEAKLRQAAGSGDFVVTGDLMRPEDRLRIVASALEHYGSVDILINNAGVGLYSTAWQAPMPQARDLFELNLFAPLEMIQLVVPPMRTKRQGCIVNVGSIAGKITLPWFTLYSASKYALGSLTDGLRMELKRDGIHAMTVCPGYVDTGFHNHVLSGRPPHAMSSRRKFAITAQQCAEAIARGVERNARTVVTPRLGWLFIGAARLFPSLVEAQMERMSGA
ncbi:MAG: SDR family NAD(P)-dependent oxidoreductase [Bryobacteraceae bacterium]